MEIDKTTLADLSVFNNYEADSLFDKINLCNTIGGKHQLHYNFSHPLQTLNEIVAIQLTLKNILQNQQHWPLQINNGCIMVIEKFFQTPVDAIPNNASIFSAYQYKLLHASDYSFIKYSAEQCFVFIKGMQQMLPFFLHDDTALPLREKLNEAKYIISAAQLNIIHEKESFNDLSIAQQLQIAYFIKYRYKQNILDLINIYFQLDAWHGMAMAVKKYHLSFPEFTLQDYPFIECKGLYHLLLKNPVAYDVSLTPDSNFIFLTGANMAGKSTYIKAVGMAVFLAHIGMGVPAQAMQLCVFDGLLSNINIADNVVKGESYFYNEVQRIKNTINKINDNKKWLILIDELFKGTNIEDAMKCSTTVIEGLLKIKKSLFILSTHLYEIGNDLKKHSNIQFNYFETVSSDNSLSFTYQIKSGISSDRLGYLILKREGVINMLNNL